MRNKGVTFASLSGGRWTQTRICLPVWRIPQHCIPQCQRPASPVLRLESPRLHPVPADLHIAPSPRMVLARIEKKPSALCVSALAQQMHLIRCHELRNAQRKQPQRYRESSGLRQFPLEFRSLPMQLLLSACFVKASLQLSERGGRWILSLHSCIQNVRSSFPKCAYLRHNFFCLVVRRAAQQTPRVARADHLRLHKETNDVCIVVDKFFRPLVPKSPIKRVHKIKSRMAANQFEALPSRPSLIRCDFHC